MARSPEPVTFALCRSETVISRAPAVPLRAAHRSHRPHGGATRRGPGRAPTAVHRAAGRAAQGCTRRFRRNRCRAESGHPDLPEAARSSGTSLGRLLSDIRLASGGGPMDGGVTRPRVGLALVVAATVLGLMGTDLRSEEH